MGEPSWSSSPPTSPWPSASAARPCSTSSRAGSTSRLVLGAAVLLALRAFTRRGAARAVARARGRARRCGRPASWSTRSPTPRRPTCAPYPSVADALWLGAYVAVGAGIVLVLRARLRRAFHADDVARRGDRRDDDRRADRDARVRPGARRHRRRDGCEVATDLAYPLADLGLLALVVTLLALTGWRPGARLGRCSRSRCRRQAVSDVLYAREIALGTDGQDTLLAPVWPAATLLLAYAAWRPLDGAGAQRRAARARLHLPGRSSRSLALGDPRLRPLPRRQHARASCSPRPRSRWPSRGWRCRSSTTCGCCGARATTR